MATIFRRRNSSVWWAAYFDSEGKRRYRSTGKSAKPEAAAAAGEMERRARRVNPDDDERRQGILRILEEAGAMALKGTLNEASAHSLLNRITEAATGESLRQATVEQWFRGWLKEKSGSRTKGTAVRYEGIIDAFLKSLSAAKRAMPLAALAFADIQKFRDQLLAGGRTAVTANIAIKVLRSPLNVARRQGLISSNPAEAVEMVAGESVEKGVFSPEDIAALLKVTDGEWRGLILAGFYTGARVSDLSNLKWASVDFERTTLAFGQRKTKRFIEIPLHPELESWLRAYHTKQKGEFVFASLAGKVVGGRNGLSGRFRALIQKAGIEVTITEKTGKKGRNRSSLSFHSLRHSFNSAMANAGVSQELRQRLTGHASKAVNDRYTHTELETLRKAVGTVPSLGNEAT
jgi:integrase